MNGTLKVDTQQLRNTAASFDSTASTVQSLTQSMCDTIGKLTGQVWSGDAQAKYTSQFSQLSDDIQRMISMIHEHVSDLNEMAAAYEDAEQANSVTASALQTDVIS